MKSYIVTTRLLLMFSCCLLLASCGGGDSAEEPIIPIIMAKSGLLVPVSSSEQLLRSVKDGFQTDLQDYQTRSLTSGNEPVLANALESDSASSQTFTTTYTQEISVDEHDYVKYDGEHLFIAPRSLSENSQPTAEKHKSAIFHPRLC